MEVSSICKINMSKGEGRLKNWQDGGFARNISYEQTDDFEGLSYKSTIGGLNVQKIAIFIENQDFVCCSTSKTEYPSERLNVNIDGRASIKGAAP